MLNSLLTFISRYSYLIRYFTVIISSNLQVLVNDFDTLHRMWSCKNHSKKNVADYKRNLLTDLCWLHESLVTNRYIVKMYAVIDCIQLYSIDKLNLNFIKKLKFTTQ